MAKYKKKKMKPNMKNSGCSTHTSNCCYNGSEY